MVSAQDLMVEGVICGTPPFPTYTLPLRTMPRCAHKHDRTGDPQDSDGVVIRGA
jgi:hypothetical protein